MSSKTEFEEGYIEGILDAVTAVAIARERGITDLRQVISLIGRAVEIINEEDGEV